MRLALKLAKLGLGMTSPNPLVGACVVKSGRILGNGFHEMAGLPHAEVNALRSAGLAAKGATLYITPEPCDHFGRTPPCTEAIVRSGVRKVVIGMKDPNPLNNGKGIRKLKKRGIETIVGVLEDEAWSINRPYIKFITERLPFVTVKLAESLDGKIATRTGDSRWITSEDSRRYVHKLRGEVDAVMVGVGTVLRDDPRLTVRDGRPLKLATHLQGRRGTPRINHPSAGQARDERKKLIRIIVDSRLRTPANAKIFADCDASPVLIATAKGSSEGKRKALEKKGAKVLVVKGKGKRVDLKSLFKRLAERDIAHVMVEGGGELAAGILEEKLADRILLFIAPKIIGGRDAVTSVEGKGVDLVSNAVKIKGLRIKRFSKDILIEGEIA